jgi:hypothetical protein
VYGYTSGKGLVVGFEPGDRGINLCRQRVDDSTDGEQNGATTVSDVPSFANTREVLFPPATFSISWDSSSFPIASYEATKTLSRPTIATSFTVRAVPVRHESNDKCFSVFECGINSLQQHLSSAKYIQYTIWEWPYDAYADYKSSQWPL